MVRWGKTDELVSIQDLLEPLREALAEKPGQRVILFGSRARGEEDWHSDIDLVLVAETKRPFPERFKDFWELIYAMLRPVQMLIYTPEEFSRLQREKNLFLRHVLEEGTVICEEPKKRGKVMPAPGPK